MERKARNTGMAALLTAAALVQIQAIRANTAQLHLDGIVIVKQLPLDGTKVIVVDREGPSTVITRDLRHFSLPLDLDRTYLLSFEREGCVTKQLLFDTKVPERYMASAPFSFPFQVTLEQPPADAPFAYAGPVGFVRFYDDIKDFGYDTDYSIARDAVLVQRLDLAREGASPAPATAQTLKAAPLPAPVPSADAPQGAFEELAPTLTEVPPLVHNTGNTSATVAPLQHVPIARPASLPRSMPKPAPAPLAAPAAPPLTSSSALLASPTTAQRTAPAARVLDDQARSEQLIVEPRRVTTVIRLTQNGHTTEYRRVAHDYGAVYFFRNGESCAEYTFNAARHH